MRIAVIADIHGNRIALETVLAHIARQDVDRIVCLGDVAALGPEPRLSLDLVREHAAITVMGNTDAWLLEGKQPTVSDRRVINEISAWGREQLTPDHLRQIATFPATSLIRLGPPATLLAFHGSPASYDDALTATTLDREIIEKMGGLSAEVLVGGHTHIALMRRLSNGALLINPGSVGLPGVGPGTSGLPVNTDVDWAEYLVIECGEGGTSFAFHRLSLPVPEMLAVARESGMPHVNWWAAKWKSAAKAESST